MGTWTLNAFSNEHYVVQLFQSVTPQGFSKHIRLNLASALPLGFIGRAEMLDFWMDEPLDIQEIRDKLQKALPLEIRILELYQVDNSLPSLQGSLLSSDYIITLPEEISILEFPGNGSNCSPKQKFQSPGERKRLITNR